MRLRSLLPVSLALVLAAAAPARLDYDPLIHLAGDCLSPALTGCNAAARPTISASQAVLGADPEPRLALELAGLLDSGPELTGGRPSKRIALR